MTDDEFEKWRDAKAGAICMGLYREFASKLAIERDEVLDRLWHRFRADLTGLLLLRRVEAHFCSECQKHETCKLPERYEREGAADPATTMLPWPCDKFAPRDQA